MWSETHFCWKTTKEKSLKVKDSLLKKDIVNMDLDVLLGKPPKLVKNINSQLSASKLNTTKL